MDDNGYYLLPPEARTAKAAKDAATLVTIPTTISVGEVLFVVKNNSAVSTVCLINGPNAAVVATPETWLLTAGPSEKQQFGPFNVKAGPWNVMRASTDAADASCTIRVFYK